MSDLTKRARSPSPPSGHDNNKRPKDLTEKQGNGVPAKPSNATTSAAADMADIDVSHKPEDGDAVDLGTGPGTDELKDDSGAAILSQGLMNPAGSAEPQAQEDVEGEVPPANISLRALIVTGDASIIIGKAGKHINEIREKSGAKLTIVRAGANHNVLQRVISC